MINLTERELTILKYATKGYGNDQIGKKIFVSIHTVKAHMSSIIRKLGARNRTNAVYIALMEHILKKEDLDKIEDITDDDFGYDE